MKEPSVSIWFLIGLQLLIFGALILGAGVYQCSHPPAIPTKMAGLHAGIWWGALMALVGIGYLIKFRVRRPDHR
jgi:hypothetical protein